MIFKVALYLLGSHEGEIVECDSFESIVDYLKTTLPALTQAQMEQTIAKVQKNMFLAVIKHSSACNTSLMSVRADVFLIIGKCV